MAGLAEFALDLRGVGIVERRPSRPEQLDPGKHLASDILRHGVEPAQANSSLQLIIFDKLIRLDDPLACGFLVLGSLALVAVLVSCFGTDASLAALRLVLDASPFDCRGI